MGDIKTAHYLYLSALVINVRCVAGTTLLILLIAAISGYQP